MRLVIAQGAQVETEARRLAPHGAAFHQPVAFRRRVALPAARPDPRGLAGGERAAELRQGDPHCLCDAAGAA